jgi:hypothetical protein
VFWKQAKGGWIFRVFGWDVAGGLKATESDRKERCGEVVRGVAGWVKMDPL